MPWFANREYLENQYSRNSIVCPQGVLGKSVLPNAMVCDPAGGNAANREYSEKQYSQNAMVSIFVLDDMPPSRHGQNRQNQGIMSKPVESFCNSAKKRPSRGNSWNLCLGTNFFCILVLIKNDWYPECDEIYISSRVKLGRSRLWQEFD